MLWLLFICVIINQKMLLTNEYSLLMCALPPFVFVQCAANLRCCEQCTSQFNDHKKNPSIQDVTTSIIFILTVCGLYYCISCFSAGNWCLVIVQRIKKRSCINENELFQHNLNKVKVSPFSCERTTQVICTEQRQNTDNQPELLCYKCEYTYTPGIPGE